MICVIATNYKEAKTWARGQFLEDDEWFFPIDLDDLKHRSNFHVIVIGDGGQNVPLPYFEKLFDLAQKQGRIGRI